MVKQIWIDWKLFIRQMYRDILKLSFVLYIFSIVILAVTSFRYEVFAYPFIYIICFGISFILCLRRKEKPVDLVEGDR